MWRVNAITPRLGRRGRIRTATVIWAMVGVGLLSFGAINLWAFVTAPQLIWSLVAVALGVAKGRMVLGRTAARTIARVEAQPDRYCLFSFFSWKSWLLVLTMILMGRFLRRSGLSPVLIYNVYVAVGTALLVGSAQLGRLAGGEGAV